MKTAPLPKPCSSIHTSCASEVPSHFNTLIHVQFAYHSSFSPVYASVPYDPHSFGTVYSVFLIYSNKLVFLPNAWFSIYGATNMVVKSNGPVLVLHERWACAALYNENPV